jgi:hypothetical protein
MNLPLFAPSLDLLIEWERQHGLLSERIYWRRAPRPAAYPNTTELPPNSRSDAAALRHWLALCDFYHFPHITYFESWDDLVRKLRAADLAAISARMAAANSRLLAELRDTWRRLVGRMFKGAAPGARRVPVEYESAMRSLYGRVPSSAEPSCARQSRPELGEWG